MSDWQTGNPPRSGYYLTSMPHPVFDLRSMVSEMWFNAREGKWYLSRFEIMTTPPGTRVTSRNPEAWQPLPEPYESPHIDLTTPGLL